MLLRWKRWVLSDCVVRVETKVESTSALSWNAPEDEDRSEGDHGYLLYRQLHPRRRGTSTRLSEARPLFTPWSRSYYVFHLLCKPVEGHCTRLWTKKIKCEIKEHETPSFCTVASLGSIVDEKAVVEYKGPRGSQTKGTRAKEQRIGIKTLSLASKKFFFFL
jgi:hypothetical protein